VRPLISELYRRHEDALVAILADTRASTAARLSLRLALEELDAHHLAINPATNGNMARLSEQEMRLLNFLDHIGANGEYEGDPVAAIIEHVNRQQEAIGMQADDMGRMGQQIADLMAELAHLRTVAMAPTYSTNGSDTGSYTPSAVELVSQETATEPPAPAATVDDDFRQRCIAEMRRLANNGTTCTQQEWNELRQDLPDFAEMLDTLRMSWRDLVAAAGLRGASGRRILKERTDEAAATSARRGNASTAMAELIDEHKANGAEPVDDSERYANHLDAYDTRVTVRQGKTPDGEPVQVVATHYMLR
jgi:hypothetical protein